MNRKTIAALIAGTCLSLSAAAADVRVAVSIGQPGFYGRINIGDFPPPAVIYSEPVVVAPVAVVRPPLYLRVPPGHVNHWARHCNRYGACGQPVYFVRDDWYMDEYLPRYRARHEDRDARGRTGPPPWAGHGHGHGHGHDRG